MTAKTTKTTIATNIVGRTARITMGLGKAEFDEALLIKQHAPGWENAGEEGQVIAAYMRDGHAKAALELTSDGRVIEVHLTHLTLKAKNRG